MTENSSTNELIPLENVVLKHANAGIALGAEQRFAESLEQWRLAAQLADANLEGEDLYYWVKGGYGAALHDVGRHRESIAVSKLVREWTLSLRQPLASMTIARAYLALGEAENAYPHIQDVHRLTGDEVFNLFERRYEADIRVALAAKA
ncbi:hypothetical protein AC244_02545 [Ensifer adhaerens]|uniref:Uncharacterized protein n=1 Tax=Ensifer adhaerens TaxID=106592 RepID=A0A0L8C6L0_ENSAD|nr:hypothetical protein [Ensifer adhaerens]KOF22428.1 hypothetical protein AC244_02545 [Ensifer adhaerens]